MMEMIPSWSDYPAKRSHLFTTFADNQERVAIKLFAGERVLTKDNRPLGKFYLAGLPPAPRGTPQIEVTLEIDFNLVLTATATDRRTGNSASLTVKPHLEIWTRGSMWYKVREANCLRARDEALRDSILMGLGNSTYLHNALEDDEEQGM
eukprot:m51a1_g11528 putative heat shock protein (150) ;mRNA; f:27-476